TPATCGSVASSVKTCGSAQTRQVPVGPVIVPLSARASTPTVGQPEAGVTPPAPLPPSPPPVGGGLLMSTSMLPPVPGEAMSSGPQAASATTLQPRTSERVRLITADGPS